MHLSYLYCGLVKNSRLEIHIGNPYTIVLFLALHVLQPPNQASADGMYSDKVPTSPSTLRSSQNCQPKKDENEGENEEEIGEEVGSALG